MPKKVLFLALGGHISNQNCTFQQIMQLTGEGWEFYGAENGFEAFETGNVWQLPRNLNELLPKPEYAGFISGAARATLLNKDGTLNEEAIAKAISFVKAGKFDYLVGSGGDDHGLQMEILRQALEECLDTKVLVVSKTMDGDKGGIDGEVRGAYVGPFADTTNGFHTAIEVGTRKIDDSYSGAWTNEVVTIVTHFGRDTNWVNLALGWYSNADIVVPGELPESHHSHSLEKIVALIQRAKERNLTDYGRAFATVVVSEGTRIQGIQHVSDKTDVHGHPKFVPGILSERLKDALDNCDIKAQTLVITYEMRNSPSSQKDLEMAELTAQQISNAMNGGITGMEAVLKFKDGEVVSELMPISLASQKRFARYYEEHHGRQFYKRKTLQPLPEIERYFFPLFIQRTAKESLLPRKPMVVNVYCKKKK